MRQDQGGTGLRENAIRKCMGVGVVGCFKWEETGSEASKTDHNFACTLGDGKSTYDTIRKRLFLLN